MTENFSLRKIIVNKNGNIHSENNMNEKRDKTLATKNT